MGVELPASVGVSITGWGLNYLLVLLCITGREVVVCCVGGIEVYLTLSCKLLNFYLSQMSIFIYLTSTLLACPLIIVSLN